jgi:hypothetical protein
MRKTIICDGDSWVFGSEIVDPQLVEKNPGKHVTGYDFLPHNDLYRHNKIFPYYLAEMMDNANVINLAYPADDNGNILRRTIDYITQNYLSQNKSTDNILLIVGWSSPERNNFWFRDSESNLSMNWRLWPQVQHFDHPAQEEMWGLYVSYLWNIEEYMPRYIHNVMMLQNFCTVHNIDWLCFNSFYQTPGKNITDWNDLNIITELDKLDSMGYQCQELFRTPFERDNIIYNYKSQWELIDSDRFYKKDQPDSTFRSFIEKNVAEPFNNWHPSPQGHNAWAKELYDYICLKNLMRNLR